MVDTPQQMFPVDVEDAPRVTLAGKEWPIPQLAIGQAKKVVPAIMSIGPALLRVAEAAERNDQAAMVQAMASFDEAAFEKLADIVFNALRRAHPNMGRGEFENMPITVTELFMAIPVVFKQVGFLKVAKAGDTAAGEAQAGVQSTGMSS